MCERVAVDWTHSMRGSTSFRMRWSQNSTAEFYPLSLPPYISLHLPLSFSLYRYQHKFAPVCNKSPEKKNLTKEIGSHLFWLYFVRHDSNRERDNETIRISVFVCVYLLIQDSVVHWHLLSKEKTEFKWYNSNKKTNDHCNNFDTIEEDECRGQKCHLKIEYNNIMRQMRHSNGNSIEKCPPWTNFDLILM